MSQLNFVQLDYIDKSNKNYYKLQICDCKQKLLPQFYFYCQASSKNITKTRNATILFANKIPIIITCYRAFDRKNFAAISILCFVIIGLPTRSHAYSFDLLIFSILFTTFRF